MHSHDLDLTSLIAGIVFVAVGAFFLADQFQTLDLQVRWVWPAVLIGLGVALLVPRRNGTDRIDPGDDRRNETREPG